MKKIFLLFGMMAMATTAVHAQYTIKGDVKGLADGMMYVQYRGQNTDSAVVKDGKFEIAGDLHIKAPTYIHLTNNVNWGVAFWMCNDNVVLTGNGENLEVAGSKTEDEYEAYQKFMTPTWDEGRAISAQMTDDVAKFDSLQNIINNVYRPKEDSVFLEFARQHPSSYITLNHIYNWRVLEKYRYERYMKGVNILTPGAFQGEQWETLQRFMTVDKALEPGQPCPALTLNDVYGKSVSLQSLKGKCVLLTISTYGIGDYNKDLVLRRDLYEKFHGYGLEMVDYQLCSDTLALIKAPANYGLKWHFVSDFKSWNNPWLKEHEIDHITQNFLIDRNGIIVGRQLFGEDLKREIEKLFE